MNSHWRLLAIIAAVLCPLWWATSLASEPNWPDHLLIGTASPGGTYYVYGEGLGKILTRALDLPVVPLATEGPHGTSNCSKLVRQSWASLRLGSRSKHGTALADGLGRSRFVRYVPSFQCTILHSNLSCCRSLGFGRSPIWPASGVGIGPRGGTSAAYFPEFFNKLKLAADFVFGEWGDSPPRYISAGLMRSLSVPVCRFLRLSSSRRRKRFGTLHLIRTKFRYCDWQCLN